MNNVKSENAGAQLIAGNTEFQNGNYEQAIFKYVEAWFGNDRLEEFCRFNISICAERLFEAGVFERLMTADEIFLNRFIELNGGDLDFYVNQKEFYGDAFDEEYYLQQHTDVKNAGVDPFTHYCQWGWKEKRNPNSWFDVSHYISENVDVASVGVEPLYHYLKWGKLQKRSYSKLEITKLTKEI